MRKLRREAPRNNSVILAIVDEVKAYMRRVVVHEEKSIISTVYEAVFCMLIKMLKPLEGAHLIRMSLWGLI